MTPTFTTNDAHTLQALAFAVFHATGGTPSGINISPLSILAGNQIYPGNGNGQIQKSTGLLGGTGVPASTIGNNGDYYFRSDGGAGTHIYFKSAGAWAGIV